MIGKSNILQKCITVIFNPDSRKWLYQKYEMNVHTYWKYIFYMIHTKRIKD